MSQEYSRREILRAIMLGGGVIAGELWWPGQKLISIPTTEEVLRYTATERYSYGWTDPGGVFGSAPIKAEGQWVPYDPHSDTLEGNEEALMFSEDSLEKMVIDVRRDLKDKLLSIKPRTVTVVDEAALTDPDDWYIKVPHVRA